MVALRGALCSERWDEAWAAIARSRCERTGRSQPAAATAVASPVASAAAVTAPVRRPRHPAVSALPSSGPKRIVNGRPTAANPWRRFAGGQRGAPAKL